MTKINVPICYVQSDKKILHGFNFNVNIPTFENPPPDFIDYLKGLDDFSIVFQNFIDDLEKVLQDKFSGKVPETSSAEEKITCPDFSAWIKE